MAQEYLILDLDGTLLFGEERQHAMVVPGRRRHSYMARETLELLIKLQEHRRLVLATGRSRISLDAIIADLGSYGVGIYAATAENGGVIRDCNGDTQICVDAQWIGRAKHLELELQDYVQSEFESCVALLNPGPVQLSFVDQWAQNHNLQHRRLVDGNKIFILAENVDKKHALTHLLGADKLASAWGIGNDLNDMDWLQSVAFSAAPACARTELLDSLKQNHGFIADNRGHEGIAEILNALC